MSQPKRKSKRNIFTLSEKAQAKIDKVLAYKKSKVVSKLIEDNL